MGSRGFRFLGMVLLLVTAGMVGLQSCSARSAPVPAELSQPL